MRCTLALILSSTLTSTALAQKTPPNLSDLLKNTKNLTQFTTLLASYEDIYANLSSQHNNITILAPNDDAFTKIAHSQIGDAFANNQTDAIRAILQYHILPGLHPAASYTGNFQFNPTWLDNATYSNVTGGQVVGGVRQSGDLNIFTSGYGSRTTVIQSDLSFTGGTLHTLDTFLVPPAPLLPTLLTFNLTSLGGALSAATLLTPLSTSASLTIFAPNNDALARLGSTLTSLSASQLASVLNYHVAAGAHYSPGLVAGAGGNGNGNGTTLLRTRNGASLRITFAANSLFVNSARVLQQDILLANGVLHVIDNVLSPNDTTALPHPALPTQSPVFAAHSLSANGLPFATFLPASTSAGVGGASSTVAGAAGSAATEAVASASASASADATGPRSTKKAGAGRVEGGRWGVGVVLGAVGFVVGGL